MHFSKVENPTSLADLSEAPNKYIATITQLEKPAEADWLATSVIWKQFTGNDGWGYEYAFINTSDSTVPLVKWEGEDPSVDGYLPYDDSTGVKRRYSDDPIQVSREMPFCWVTIRRRKRNDIGWEDFSHAVL